jgi:hypothetical protein
VSKTYDSIKDKTLAKFWEILNFSFDGAAKSIQKSRMLRSLISLACYLIFHHGWIAYELREESALELTSERRVISMVPIAADNSSHRYPSCGQLVYFSRADFVASRVLKSDLASSDAASFSSPALMRTDIAQSITVIYKSQKAWTSLAAARNLTFSPYSTLCQPMTPGPRVPFWL